MNNVAELRKKTNVVVHCDSYIYGPGHQVLYKRNNEGKIDRDINYDTLAKFKMRNLTDMKKIKEYYHNEYVGEWKCQNGCKYEPRLRFVTGEQYVYNPDMTMQKEQIVYGIVEWIITDPKWGKKIEERRKHLQKTI